MATVIHLFVDTDVLLHTHFCQTSIDLPSTATLKSKKNPPQNTLLASFQLVLLQASKTVELATTYAALILADEGVAITQESILALTSAAKVEVEPIWASLLAKALEGKDVKDMLTNVGAGGGECLIQGLRGPAREGNGRKNEMRKRGKKEKEQQVLRR